LISHRDTEAQRKTKAKKTKTKKIKEKGRRWRKGENLNRDIQDKQPLIDAFRG